MEAVPIVAVLMAVTIITSPQLVSRLTQRGHDADSGCLMDAVHRITESARCCL